MAEEREEQRQGDAEETSPVGAQGPSDEERPSEEELRAQLEEEIRKVRVEDVLMQSVVSLLNLSARRIANDEERDLGQAKVGIDAARAVVDLVRPEAQPQLKQAISELQLLYAKHAGAGEATPPEDKEEGEAAVEAPPKRDSRLWTPPGA
jgi:hypothetical protein